MTITTSMKNFYSWTKRIFYWFVDTHEFWITVVVVLGSLLFVFLKGADERAPRITGLFLQLLGIGTVAWGIRKTRILFNRPSLFKSICSEIKSLFRHHGREVHLEAKGNTSGTFTGRSHIFSFASPEATIEERVAALEKNIKNIYTHITEIKTEMNENTRAQREELSLEREQRMHNFQKLNKKLEATETGGLNISAMGALWLSIGVILSTTAAEISTFLK